MRFLVDENIHHGILRFLKKLGHNATLSPKGLTNGKVLALSISQKRILVTHDTDFAKPEITAKHHGIILVRIEPRYFEKLKTSLFDLLSDKTTPESFTGKLLLLFEDRVE